MPFNGIKCLFEYMVTLTQWHTVFCDLLGHFLCGILCLWRISCHIRKAVSASALLVALFVIFKYNIVLEIFVFWQNWMVAQVMNQIWIRHIPNTIATPSLWRFWLQDAHLMSQPAFIVSPLQVVGRMNAA